MSRLSNSRVFAFFIHSSLSWNYDKILYKYVILFSVVAVISRNIK
jgi:hypothetical protein